MARRLDKTLVDYLVIAISPALIMTLIGSLIWFLLEVFYRGQFSGRLHWILSLFIMGAVLIGRISIEEGRERAALYAGPLAIVTLLAINRFVELRGVPFAFLINCGLIGLIWWCAHKLTWDCTLIDEGAPDSGEGLLEAVGLDRPEKPTPATSAGPLAAGTTKWSGPETVTSPLPLAGEEPGTRVSPRPLAGEGSGVRADDPEGTTSRPDSQAATWQDRLARWWEGFVERRRRPHAPGLWVVYFSLAALPLFGVGQLFIRSTNLESRRYVFHLMLVYVGSGLGLLLATSFLGLRRYLRQRRLEMPLAMVNVWLGMGVTLIAVVMALALLLPRPNAEYAISQFAPGIDSPEQTSSRYGMGKEGVEEDKPWSRADKLDEKGKLQSDTPGDKGQSPSDEKGDKGGAASDSQDKQQPQKATSDSSGKGESQGESDKSQGKAPSRAKDDAGASKPQPEDRGAAGQAPSEKGDEKTRSQGEKKDAEAKKGADRAGRDGEKPGRKAESPAKPSDQRPAEKPNGQQPSRGESRKEEAKSPPGAKPSVAPRPPEAPAKPPSPPPVAMPGIAAWLLVLLKWILYAAIVGLAAWWAWRNWQTVLAALRDFRQAWRDFWQNLFAKKPKKAAAVAEEAAPAKAQPRPFADFADPFARGIAGRYAPEELVRYSFLALEAWAREHGCPRESDDTPHEFAAKVGLSAPSLAEDARQLADLYCQAAYAPDALSPSSVEPLRRLWRNFPRTAAAVQAVQ